jgi:2-amino-4-hydroxy-6-hydroxymethyldihydropteridine diphosphokinase
MTNRCAIALGSNLGDSINILKDSLQSLDRIPGITLQAVSSWYRTKPVGNPQPDYLNGCAMLEAQQSPQELLVLLQAIELQFGRIRKEKWGARTLDLDLILYENLIIDTPDLQIPHPRMRDRAFVLIPLAEIAPDAVDPVTQKTISQLAKIVDNSGVEIFAQSIPNDSRQRTIGNYQPTPIL